MALECEQLDSGEHASKVWRDRTGWNAIYWYRINTGNPLLALTCPLLPGYGAALDPLLCPGCLVTNLEAAAWAQKMDPDGTGGHTFVQVTFSTPTGGGTPATAGQTETELVAGVETINVRRGLKFDAGDANPSLRPGQNGWTLTRDERGDLFIGGGEGVSVEVGSLTAKVSVYRGLLEEIDLRPIFAAINNCPVNRNEFRLPPVRGTYDGRTGTGLRLLVPKGMARFRTMEGPEVVGTTIKLTYHIAISEDWFAYWDRENRDGQPMQERIFASKVYDNDVFENLWAP